MAELEPTPLSALLDPPLGDPPPVADLERRAERLRQRRWAGRGAGAAAAIALVAGAVALAQPDGEQTLRTAAPPSVGGAGATAGGSGTSGAEPALAILDSFEAGGRTWLLTFVSGPQLCVELRGGADRAGPACWRRGPLEPTVLDAGGATYLVALTSAEVREVSYGPARPDDVLPPRGGSDGGAVFGKVMPAGLTSVELVGATDADQRAHTRTVTLHGRVASINGELASPAPPSTTATTRVPTTTPSIEPTRPNPDTPVSTVVPPTTPTTTVPGPPPGGNPQRVSVTPGATSLQKHVFETAFASGAASVAVRWWDGVEPCSVLGRVDVVESADKVTITLWTGIGPGAESRACIAMAVYKETIVALSAPLGSRTIVDGAA